MDISEEEEPLDLDKGDVKGEGRSPTLQPFFMVVVEVVVVLTLLQNAINGK
jgi:hypothetical protein